MFTASKGSFSEVMSPCILRKNFYNTELINQKNLDFMNAEFEIRPIK